MDIMNKTESQAKVQREKEGRNPESLLPMILPCSRKSGLRYAESALLLMKAESKNVILTPLALLEPCRQLLGLQK